MDTVVCNQRLLCRVLLTPAWPLTSSVGEKHRVAVQEMVEGVLKNIWKGLNVPVVRTMLTYVIGFPVGAEPRGRCSGRLKIVFNQWLTASERDNKDTSKSEFRLGIPLHISSIPPPTITSVIPSVRLHLIISWTFWYILVPSLCVAVDQEGVAVDPLGTVGCYLTAGSGMPKPSYEEWTVTREPVVFTFFMSISFIFVLMWSLHPHRQGSCMFSGVSGSQLADYWLYSFTTHFPGSDMRCTSTPTVL